MSAVAVAGIASVGLGVATAAGALNPPAAPSASSQIANLTRGQINLMPSEYQANATYNPLYASLNSTIAWQNLFGAPASSTSMKLAQKGWYDAQGNFLGTLAQYPNAPQPGATLEKKGNMMSIATAASPGELATAEAAQPRLLGLQTAARTQDIADVQNLGPAAMAAMRAYDPTVTGLYDTMGAQAQALVNTNGALDPFTQTALQQNYRSGEAARGMAGGTGDAAMEAYYQAATQEQRRLTNLGVAGQVAGQVAGYYGDPFQQVIGRTSGGVQPSTPSYTANQPNSLNISPGAYNLASQGYGMQYQTQNAGWSQQMGALQSLVSPGTAKAIGGGVSSLNNYFNPPTSGYGDAAGQIS